ERLSAADRVGASGGGGHCAAARTQPGSRGPAAGGTAEKADCEEKETGRGSGGPPGGTAANGLGSAYARPSARTSACACTRPGAFIPDRGGSIGDQLSLAVAIIQFAAR